MWQTVDYNGNTVKWYESELIEKLKANCQLMIDACNKCEGDANIDCIDCTQGGKAIMAYNVLDLIQENEK